MSLFSLPDVVNFAVVCLLPVVQRISSVDDFRAAHFPTLVLVLENFHEIDFLLNTVFVSLLPSPALLIDSVSC